MGVYLGSTIAGKYTKKLLVIAIIIAGVIMVTSISLMHLAVIVVGSLIILDYVLYVYRGWKLIRSRTVTR